MDFRVLGQFAACQRVDWRERRLQPCRELGMAAACEQERRGRASKPLGARLGFCLDGLGIKILISGLEQTSLLEPRYH
jgi:hypothetical protein